jgi:hypothetical protein
VREIGIKRWKHHVYLSEIYLRAAKTENEMKQTKKERKSKASYNETPRPVQA